MHCDNCLLPRNRSRLNTYLQTVYSNTVTKSSYRKSSNTLWVQKKHYTRLLIITSANVDVFQNSFIDRYRNLIAKEYCKSVYICCQSYDQKSSVLFFYSHCRSRHNCINRSQASNTSWVLNTCQAAVWLCCIVCTQYGVIGLKFFFLAFS